MVDLADTMIFGFITLFVVALIAIIGFLAVGNYVAPTISGLGNTTSTFDISDKIGFGMNIFYIAMGILIAIPIILIIFKFFYEREPYAY